jgi:hypothetical protein
MKKNETVRPGSKDYDVNNPQKLTIPRYSSTTENRDSGELPATENLNDLQKDKDNLKIDDTRTSDSDLGNKRADDEENKERIIRR